MVPNANTTRSETQPIAPASDSGPLPDCSIGIDIGALSSVPQGWESSAFLGRVLAAVRHLRRSVASVHVEVVDDRAMEALHQARSGIAGTTDVLTFLASEPGAPIEVEIAVCIDEARRRSLEFGHGIDRELLLYVVHGLLHCAGHDDHDPDAYAAMHAEEDRILEAIGVGATFAPGRAPGLATRPDRAAPEGPSRR